MVRILTDIPDEAKLSCLYLPEKPFFYPPPFRLPLKFTPTHPHVHVFAETRMLFPCTVAMHAEC